MSVKKKVLKAASYAAAPKLTFLVNNPKKSAWLKASTWAGRQVAERVMPDRFGSRSRGASLGMTAAKGLGAAAIAAPLGWWLGRRMLSRSGGTQAV